MGSAHTDGQRPPSGEHNGVSYDAYCFECGKPVEYRGGAWICPTHRDTGHVRFEARPKED